MPAFNFDFTGSEVIIDATGAAGLRNAIARGGRGGWPPELVGFGIKRQWQRTTEFAGGYQLPIMFPSPLAGRYWTNLHIAVGQDASPTAGGIGGWPNGGAGGTTVATDGSTGGWGGGGGTRCWLEDDAGNLSNTVFGAGGTGGWSGRPPDSIVDDGTVGYILNANAQPYGPRGHPGTNGGRGGNTGEDGLPEHPFWAAPGGVAVATGISDDKQAGSGGLAGSGPGGGGGGGWGGWFVGGGGGGGMGIGPDLPGGGDPHWWSAANDRAVGSLLQPGGHWSYGWCFGGGGDGEQPSGEILLQPVAILIDADTHTDGHFEFDLVIGPLPAHAGWAVGRMNTGSVA